MVNTSQFINSKSLDFNNSCHISGEFFSDTDFTCKNVIKLDCGHCFKYNYFIYSYYILKSTNDHIHCPYCKSYISHIPFIIKKKIINLRHTK